MSFQVLLYYKYISIFNPQSVLVEQRKFCTSLGLKGRIIISKEGINGTVEGTTQNTEKYIKAMNKSPIFQGIHFKKSRGSGQAFPKLSIKVRGEIVALGTEVNPNQFGQYLTAQELKDWFDSKKEFYILDMRNDYEYQSGYFEGSLFTNTRNFYDLPKILPKLSHLKNKTVVTVCTGGVRCEKGSGLLLQNGFSEVYQLKDGIQTFMEQYPNQYFKGKLYVFDNRLTIGYNLDSPEHQVVGKCLKCGKSCDSYVNCGYNFCHFHYICCNSCKDRELGLAFCNQGCKDNYLKVEKSKLN